MISYDEKTRIFQITTPNSTYMMGLYAGGYLTHLYYGRQVEDTDCGYLFRRDESERALHSLKRDAVGFFGTFPFEYPAHGTGDYRDNCLCVRDEEGHRVCKLLYESHRILSGKPALRGMPATFPGKGPGQEAQTLEITMADSALGLKILLRYSVFADSDAIVRSVVAENTGSRKLYLERVMSACLDMDNEKYDLTTLQGTWGRERRIRTRKLTEGKFAVGSVSGKTSHEAQPFLMLTEQGATQKQGEVYGIALIYSGNFLAEAELDFQDSVRLTMGIHPEGFEWVLEPEARFEAPEAVLVYSSVGIGAMTRCFHDLFRNHLIRSRFLHRERPILINNWEATYFDFDDNKLVDIAREAKKLGIEMLVMDDGWFGKRNGDECSLGDWYVNREKLREGLKPLVDRVNAEGLKFGIWLEPEMVSPDSDLYRAHPDWAVQVPGREITMSRHQYVLDLTRPEVLDYAYESVAGILRSANIEYVKWDMNRPLSDIGSACLDREHMGEFFHRYVLGVYQLQERLLREFPDILLENCSGGGGRFDPGMLYYCPQIWASDNMDPVQRLVIQEGTALLYPLSTMGAHVCVCPNHTTGRTTPFMTRGNVAMAGAFGYELDVTKMSGADRAEAVRLNQSYHRCHKINREGDYYRIASFRENGMYDCWQVVSKDRQEFLLTYVQVRYENSSRPVRLRLEGLEPKARYRLEGQDRSYSGEMLMNAGYLQESLWGDYNSCLLHFVKENGYGEMAKI